MPWSPAAGLSLDLRVAGATSGLFSEGLPDPRGCEYREIRLVAGSVWGGAWEVTTHGWVLPDDSANAPHQRFAIAWNGLVYPVTQVGPPANVDSDILSDLQDSRIAIATSKPLTPDLPFFLNWSSIPEGTTVSQRALIPIKVCYLLRLGDDDLASAVWKAINPRNYSHFDNGSIVDGREEPPGAPFGPFATDWRRAQFDRCLCAHLRGDDRLALLDARALDQVRTNDPKEFPFLNDQLTALIADEDRRLHEPPAPAPGTAETGKAARVRQLIADLENVSATQRSQPGGVDLTQDPRVLALVAMGDSAVGPLIETYEKDGRLTRSVYFYRDFTQDRHVVSVSDAAYTAICLILHTQFVYPN